jgi:hypothetical protein
LSSALTRGDSGAVWCGATRTVFEAGFRRPLHDLDISSAFVALYHSISWRLCA